jgi:CHRD domain
MKAIIPVLLVSGVICQATLLPMGISPAGTDAAVGLSPSNEVPPVLNSTGSGGPISGGVLFDTNTSTLMLTIGYGSAAGFTDLTGPATGMTLNGPAATNETAAVLDDLSALSFPAANPAAGGIIFGSVIVPANAVTDLLAGLDYINISTTVNSNGELRGHLVLLMPNATNLPPTNLPPTIICPEPITAQCGSNTVVQVEVGSPTGSALTVVWSLDGITVQTNLVPAGTPPTNHVVSFSGKLPLGTNMIQIIVTDSSGLSASCETTVTVIDTVPPVIIKACASPSTLWPPNHKMVTVTVTAVVKDNCGSACWKIISVKSNEPVNGKGDGDTAPDWLITGNHTVLLRAERSGKGSGRIYTITIQATDASGEMSTPQTVTVKVPHGFFFGFKEDDGHGWGH